MPKRSIKKEFEKYDSLNKKILTYLVQLREEKGISQRQLAISMGVDPAALFRIENGTTYLSMPYYLLYCDLLGLDPVLTMQRAILK